MKNKRLLKKRKNNVQTSEEKDSEFQLSEQIKQSEDENGYGKYECPHYMRKCQFYTPCCKEIYRCRFCHDDAQDHYLHRDTVNQIVCSDCGTKQPIQQSCEKCKLKFGMYFCLECKLFDDDESKGQFHCDGCSICRIGDKDKFFHCPGCNMCLPINLKGKHKCIENLSHTNCPVCMEDIHTSREPSQIPPCHHLIHKSCFNELTLNHHQTTCPICHKSLYNEEALKPLWTLYDNEIQAMPMPTGYQDLLVETLCQDCQTTCMATFHVIGLKCETCGGYNTVRKKGPFLMRAGSELLEVEISETGMTSVATAEDSQSSISEELHIRSPATTPRTQSPIFPFWLEDDGDTEGSFSSSPTSPVNQNFPPNGSLFNENNDTFSLIVEQNLDELSVSILSQCNDLSTRKDTTSAHVYEGEVFSQDINDEIYQNLNDMTPCDSACSACSEKCQCQRILVTKDLSVSNSSSLNSQLE